MNFLDNNYLNLNIPENTKIPLFDAYGFYLEPELEIPPENIIVPEPIQIKEMKVFQTPGVKYIKNNGNDYLNYIFSVRNYRFLDTNIPLINSEMDIRFLVENLYPGYLVKKIEYQNKIAYLTIICLKHGEKNTETFRIELSELLYFDGYCKKCFRNKITHLKRNTDDYFIREEDPEHNKVKIHCNIHDLDLIGSPLLFIRNGHKQCES